MLCTSTQSFFTNSLCFHYCTTWFSSCLFSLLSRVKVPKVHHEICYLYVSECGLSMPRVEICQHTLHISFLDQMCAQTNENRNFWEEDTHKTFPAFRSVNSCKGEACCFPRGNSSYYNECQIV